LSFCGASMVNCTAGAGHNTGFKLGMDFRLHGLEIKPDARLRCKRCAPRSRRSCS
jgi:hypothetical protein